MTHTNFSVGGALDDRARLDRFLGVDAVGKQRAESVVRVAVDIAQQDVGWRDGYRLSA